MTPEEIQRIMQLQMLLSGQGQQSSGTDMGAGPAPQQAPNPLLIGNDGLRQQFAEHPELAPPNAAQWLDQREQHLLGNDDPPPLVTSVAPAPSPPPMLPDPSQMAATAPQSLPPPPAPQQPSGPPMLPQAAAEPPAMVPAPLPNMPAAPMLPARDAQITQLPQQAPVMSQVSPAPKAPAEAHIDNNVTMPQRTFTPAYQPPQLPTFLANGLAPNLGAYKPAPSMPGYAMPRTGNPFRKAAPPQLAPDFGNPFGNQFAGPGGPIAGGGIGGGYGTGVNDQQPYQDSLFSQYLVPRQMPQF